MKVGIIGAGTMGQGIAKAFAQVDGYEVALCDIKQEWAEGGKAKIVKGYARLVEKGKIRYIGISNMTIPKLEAVLPLMKIKPAACELELHPCFQQQEQYDYLVAHNIQPVGYMPLGSPRRPERDICPEDVADMQTPEMQEIAKHTVFIRL